MNLGQLRTSVRNRLGVPSTDALFTDTVTNDLINGALHAIETRHDWPWLEVSETATGATGTGTITPGASGATGVVWVRTIALTKSGRQPLERKSIEFLDTLLGTSGDPIFYGVFGDSLVIRPLPTGTFAMQHRYIRSEVDLSSDSDTPLIPASYHSALVEYTAYLGFRRVGKTPEAGAALAAYKDWEDTMLGRADRTSDSEGGGNSPDGVAPAKPAGR